MFIGHYGVSFVLAKEEKGISLGWLFLAVQFLDILWALFVLLGIERLRIVQGFMEASFLDLYYMPFTHGIVSALFWSVLAGLLFVKFSKVTAKVKVGLIIGVAVFSHFILDIFVHKPDLLIFGDLKIGFGLWNNVLATYLLEAIILVIGLFFYLKATKAKDNIGKYAPFVFVIGLLIVNYINLYLPMVVTDKVFAVEALFFYTVFAGVAFWMDKKRQQTLPSSRYFF